jgi:hypothetical protein
MTVIYGTSCAPYLAMRTLRHLVQEGKSRFPLSPSCIDTNIYAKDMFASDALPVAIRKRQELVEILESVGIALDI